MQPICLKRKEGSKENRCRRRELILLKDFLLVNRVNGIWVGWVVFPMTKGSYFVLLLVRALATISIRVGRKMESNLGRKEFKKLNECGIHLDVVLPSVGSWVLGGAQKPQGTSL